MVRIEIQLPDDIHNRATELAKAQGKSLSELVQRGLELTLNRKTIISEAAPSWRLPVPRHLGWRGPSDAEIKELAQ